MKEKWVLRVPKTVGGDTFIRLFKQYLNTDTYTVIKRYTGKRPKGTSQVSTKAENATSTRLYIEEKQRSYWPPDMNARPEVHMTGSIVPTIKLMEEVKREANSTIEKTRLEERIETLKYKIDDLEEISNKHRELNGSLRVEARELLKVATTMMNILEQIEFSAVDNICYDEIPWKQIEEVLNTYGK